MTAPDPHLPPRPLDPLGVNEDDSELGVGREHQERLARNRIGPPDGPYRPRHRH